jgi:CheY-like chemotaxis protein
MPLPQGKACILFVDDEESLVRLGEQILTHFGYEVVGQTSSVDALQLFRTTPQRFHLVITDQTMPHMSGEILAGELRRIRPDIPIILCTGFSHVMDETQARALGLNAFLLKPCTGKELALAVQQVLAPRSVQGN